MGPIPYLVDNGPSIITADRAINEIDSYRFQNPNQVNVLKNVSAFAERCVRPIEITQDKSRITSIYPILS